MPNSPMSETFCRYDDFEVHTKEYVHSLFFITCLIIFYGFLQNLELGLCSFSRSKIHENVIEHTFITFLGS
jgi:hypothetical protein